MRLLISLLFCFFIFLNINSQSFINITHQPVGNSIILTYDISDLKQGMLVDVSLYCSIDNFKNPLHSISGNGAGERVMGGKNKTIVWDVLKDREDLIGDKIEFELRGLAYNGNEKENLIIIDNADKNIILNKEQAYSTISGTLNDYINYAKDLKDAFLSEGKRSMDYRDSFNKLVSAYQTYNKAYLVLFKQRSSYENYVNTFWHDEFVTKDVRDLFEYTVGDVHNVYILTLNKSVDKINEINSSKNKNSKKINEEKKQLLNNIDLQSAQLEKKLEELEKRINRTLIKLSQ